MPLIPKGPPWTERETKTLRASAHEGIDALAAQLPGRTKPAIRQRAAKLGIKMKRSPSGDGGEHMRGKLAIPLKGLPLVKQFFAAINARRAHLHEVARVAGVATCSIGDWRRKTPRIDTFDAALRTLGLKLAIVPAEAEESALPKLVAEMSRDKRTPAREPKRDVVTWMPGGRP
jgi:hypothetical protein